TILRWLKNPGDKIEQDESVLEVATDKVDTEVPSTHGGTLTEILAKEGEVVQVGKPIAVISTDGDDPVSTPSTEVEAKAQTKPVEAVPQPAVKELIPKESNGSEAKET